MPAERAARPARPASRPSACGRGRLTAACRRQLPLELFALPAHRAYPMDTVKRARNARARAVQALARGRLTYAEAAEIFERTAARWGLELKIVACVVELKGKELRAVVRRCHSMPKSCCPRAGQRRRR